MRVLDGWRFCPRCAETLVHGDGLVECDACGFTFYANSQPAVSALVLDERGRVLLARRAHDPDEGLWDVPGGFLEEGEEPLDGLRRELLEETGLTVAVGDFIGSFVDTYGVGAGSPSVLSLVWEARVAGGRPKPADDVCELQWFEPERLPADEELAFRWLAPALRAWASGRPATLG